MGSRITLGVAGALAALVVSVVVMGTPTPATAVQGQAVLAGETNTSANGTLIQNTRTSVPACTNSSILAGFIACGSNGVVGFSSGFGSVGVSGFGASGVTGYGTSSAGAGVLGQNTSTGNGVEGEADSELASGVYGQNNGAGYGVAGRANGGVGMLGDSANGTGVLAVSTNGTALSVAGKAKFSRSGTKAVAGTTTAPKSSVKITNVTLTANSFVIVTPQTNTAGVWVQAAVPNVSGGSITIYLNQAVTNRYVVGWMVIEHP